MKKSLFKHYSSKGASKVILLSSPSSQISMGTTAMFYLVPSMKTKMYLSFKAAHLLIFTYLEQSDNHKHTDGNLTEARGMGWSSPRKAECSSKCCSYYQRLQGHALPSLSRKRLKAPSKEEYCLRSYTSLGYVQGKTTEHCSKNNRWIHGVHTHPWSLNNQKISGVFILRFNLKMCL